jgi:hypothetical protein
MGLLDDAIREHLELKRRHGADPDEVARLEDEALGDPRSGSFVEPEATPAEPAAPAPIEPEPAPAAAEEEPAAPEPEPEPELATPDPEAAAPAPRDEPWLEDDDRPEPAVGQPTAEFTPPEVEEESEPEVVRPDEEPAVDEDVLEETPDFLQETPEHDRLWFEQRPPRDFDFDS